MEVRFLLILMKTVLISSIRLHGKGSQYDNVRIGMNSRLDTIQAAVLLAKLEIFPSELKQRHKISRWYNTLLSDWVEVPSLPARLTSAWAQFTIQVDNRDSVQAELRTKHSKHSLLPYTFAPTSWL